VSGHTARGRSGGMAHGPVGGDSYTTLKDFLIRTQLTNL
jgi:hypothetical protein